MGKGRYDILWRHDEAADTALGEAWYTASTKNAHRMGQIIRTGAWMSVLSSTVNGTDLGAQEWRDPLFLQYVINPPDLPYHCDGCSAAFNIYHALD